MKMFSHLANWSETLNSLKLHTFKMQNPKIFLAVASKSLETIACQMPENLFGDVHLPIVDQEKVCQQKQNIAESLSVRNNLQ